MRDNGSAAGFGIGLLVGAAIGLAAGILYAPKSGEETRAMLKEKAVMAKEKARNIIEKARGKSAESEEA